MVRQRKELFVLSLLVVAVLALVGCPRQPEVKEAIPGALSPIAPRPEVAQPGAPKEAPPPKAAEAPSPKVAEEVIKPKKPEAIKEAAVKPEALAPVEFPLKDVFFDFDRALIREDMQQVLDENVKWLKANPQAKITIEGHCDERGTNEYNLALGERRAKAAREYLVAAGIEANRISIISFGEERPFVLGHDESAWKWNRRAHFVVTAR